MRALRPLPLLCLLAGCAPDLDYPVVEVTVVGAVEAVTSVSVVLAPASEGSASAKHEGVAVAPSTDGAWRVTFSTLGVGTYAVTARALDQARTVLQVGQGAAPVRVATGGSGAQLQLGPVDCAALDCSGLDDACHAGVCDGATGLCAARPRDDGYGCSDGDDCTAGDRCRGGACVGAPLDEDGDGVTPVRCAAGPGAGDCDDADIFVSAGAPEACDGKDNDCDGLVDEGLGLGDCYAGPPGTRDVGRCHGGGLLCDVATAVHRCAGQVLPTPETPRDATDNDCDGETDEPEVGCLDCGPLGTSVAAAALPPGRHEVIVALVPPAGSAAADLPVEAVLAQQQALLDELAAAVAGQPGLEFSPGRRFRTLLALSGEANLAAVGWLLESPRVAGVMKDFTVRASLSESAPLSGAPRLREAAGVTGEGVAVAVVDTGIDYTHPAFGGCDAPGRGAGCRVVAGYDFVDDEADPMDPVGHGTQVAGVIAGAAAEGCAAGVAPGAAVVALRVLDASGGARFSDVVAALDWVYEHGDAHGVRIVALSLATAETFASAALCDFDLVAAALHRLAARGLLVVAAAGGSGDAGGLSFPACASGVLSVGAVYDSDLPGRFEHCLAETAGGCTRSCADLDPRRAQVACFSNGGADLDLVAPGEPITAASPGGACATGAGTSLAAGHVAGVAALLWAEDAERTRDEIVERLRRGGVLGTDHRSGLAVVRLDAAASAGPLGCSDADGDGVGTGLRCPRQATPCAGADGAPCETGHLGLCAGGRLWCGEGGVSLCAPDATPATEVCDGYDEDCDGETDEEGAWGCTPRYLDADGDGFGVGDPRCLCAAEGLRRAEQPGDCAPDDPDVYPGAWHRWEAVPLTADDPYLVQGGGGVVFGQDGAVELPVSWGAYGDNLVANPSASQRHTDGWGGTSWTLRCDHAYVRTAPCCFGATPGEQEGHQSPSLAEWAEAIGRGQAEVLFRTWAFTTAPDRAEVRFLLQEEGQVGMGGGSLWSHVTGPTEFAGDWHEVTAEVAPPVGTHHAHVSLYAPSCGDGCTTDAYFDDTEVRVRVQEHAGPASLVFERTFAWPVTWGVLAWEAQTPGGTGVTASARSLPDPDAPAGTWSDAAPGQDLSDLEAVSDGHRTLQVRLTLTGEGLDTPRLHGFSAEWTAGAVSCGGD